jgi:hypothetical protein
MPCLKSTDGTFICSNFWFPIEVLQTMADKREGKPLFWEDVDCSYVLSRGWDREPKGADAKVRYEITRTMS